MPIQQVSQVRPGSHLQLQTWTSTNKTTLTFTLSTGAFRGTVSNPARPGTKRIPFSGVLVQNQNVENSWFLGYGCGWFMGTNQCGVIHLYAEETN